MRMHETIWQHNYDYYATMYCEHCEGMSLDKHGYNDANYHLNVIPAMLCPHCGKNSDGNTDKTRNGFTGNPLEKIEKQPVQL